MSLWSQFVAGSNNKISVHYIWWQLSEKTCISYFQLWVKKTSIFHNTLRILQKRTQSTITKSPVHLKTQLCQTVHTCFLKTPRAPERRNQHWLWIIGRPCCLSRGEGLDRESRILRQNFSKSPCPPPSKQQQSAVPRPPLLWSTDQGQRQWPPAGVVNAAPNLRGPRLPPHMWLWTAGWVNAGPPAVAVWMEEAPLTKEWMSHTNTSLTSSCEH